MKKFTILINLSLLVLLVNAQSNYVLKGNMTGTALNYVGQTAAVPSPTAGTNVGWNAYFSATAVNQKLDIVSMSDTDTGSLQGDVIRITSTATNSDLANNARLVQRLCVEGSTAIAPLGLPVGSYKLKFKAKATNSNVANLVVTLRSSGSNTPAFLIDGYTTGSYPASSPNLLSQVWTEFTVNFDLTKTASSFISTATITTGIAVNQYPVICFSLQSAAGSECMIDDVSFVSNSLSVLNDISTNQDKLKYKRTGNKIEFSEVSGNVTIIDAMGKIVNISEAENNVATFSFTRSGLYIVRNGNRVAKFILD